MMLQLNHYINIFAHFVTYVINVIMPSKVTINIYTHQDILHKRTSLSKRLLQLTVDIDRNFPVDEA